MGKISTFHCIEPPKIILQNEVMPIFKRNTLHIIALNVFIVKKHVTHPTIYHNVHTRMKPHYINAFSTINCVCCNYVFVKRGRELEY